MRFKDIVGQEDAKALLSKAIINNKISHAYIISGEEDSGKKMLAEAFATMLLCENRVEEDSCGECHSCKQSKSHNNPDIIKLYKEFLYKPLSHLAEKLLHTSYTANRERYPEQKNK